MSATNYQTLNADSRMSMSELRSMERFNLAGSHRSPTKAELSRLRRESDEGAIRWMEMGRAQSISHPTQEVADANRSYMMALAAEMGVEWRDELWTFRVDPPQQYGLSIGPEVPESIWRQWLAFPSVR